MKPYVGPSFQHVDEIAWEDLARDGFGARTRPLLVKVRSAPGRRGNAGRSTTWPTCAAGMARK